MTEQRPRSFIVRIASRTMALLDGTRRLLLNLLMLVLIVGAVVVIWQRVKGPVLQEKTTLVLDIQGAITDQPSGGSTRSQALAQLRGQGQRQARLRDVLSVLDTAARDDKVTQALLMLDGLDASGLVTLREVAAAIDRFKANGKKVVAWGGSYDQRQYFLAAHADEVWLHPMGVVYIEGYGRYRSYYKDAFDRLGVSANVVRAGKFKNAAETYSASGPSPETIESDLALYGSLWTTWTGNVEKARKLAPGSIAAGIDGLPGTLQAVGGDAAKLALQSKLVDALKTRDEMRALLIERGAKEENTFRQVSFGEYLARITPQKSADAIGVIVAQGEIGDGHAGPGAIGGLSTAEQIRKAREADDVKALILRVNSPGGSAFGSELVRRELELTRAAGKPVVVSMGDLAASGGYWISMAADEIIADEATITGSIGVVGMLPSAEPALAKLGIRSAGTTTTWLAGAMDVKRTPDPRLVATVQSAIDHAYSHFIGLVAKERKLTREQVDAVAQGRVWSGKDALKHTLVDRLGTWGDAVAAAQKRAKLAEGTPVRLRYFEAEPGRLQRLLGRFGLEQAQAEALAQAVQALLGTGTGAGPAGAAAPAAAALLGTLSPELAAALLADLGWLAEVAARRQPYATATHCLCGAP
jgi:protease-4